MTTPEEICDWILERVRLDAKGDSSPVFAESSDNVPVILDMESGRTYHIRLEEF